MDPHPRQGQLGLHVREPPHPRHRPAGLDRRHPVRNVGRRHPQPLRRLGHVLDAAQHHFEQRRLTRRGLAPGITPGIAPCPRSG
ncbi:MAG: hypothetical protein AAF333_01920 [Planctomycetota bacterium]